MKRTEVIYDWKLNSIPWDLDVSTVSFAVRYLILSSLVFLFVCLLLPAAFVAKHFTYLAYWLIGFTLVTCFIWSGLVQLRERPRAYYLERIGRVYRPLQYLNHWILPYPLGYPSSSRVWGLVSFLGLGLVPPYFLDLWERREEIILNFPFEKVPWALAALAALISLYLAYILYEESREDKSEVNVE